MVVGLENYGPVVVVAHLPAVVDIPVVACIQGYTRNVQCVWLLYHFADCTHRYSCVVHVVYYARFCSLCRSDSLVFSSPSFGFSQS